MKKYFNSDQMEMNFFKKIKTLKQQKTLYIYKQMNHSFTRYGLISNW